MPGLINPHRSLSDAKGKEIWPTKSSLQEVLVDTTGLEQQGRAVDSGTSTSTIIEEDAQYSDIDASMSEMGDASMDGNMLTALSATIDCPTMNDPVSNSTIFQSPTNERQRPTRVTGRPSRYRDSNFEKQFQPVSRRNCRKIETKSRTKYDVIYAGKYQDSGRGEHKENVSPTGNEIVSSTSEQTTQEPTPATCANLQEIISQKRQPKVGRHPHFITKSHQYPSRKILADIQSSGNDRYYYTSSGNKNKKKTGDSKNLPKAPHLKEKRLNYTRHQASDRWEPAVADSDDHNEFLIASRTTTYNQDSTYYRPDGRRLKFRNIRQTAPLAALMISDCAVSTTHRGSDVDAQATTTIKRLLKENCRYGNQQKNLDNQYRTNDQWDIAQPWKHKKSKQLDPHPVNATAATISLSSLSKKFQESADRNYWHISRMPLIDKFLLLLLIWRHLKAPRNNGIKTSSKRSSKLRKARFPGSSASIIT